MIDAEDVRALRDKLRAMERGETLEPNPKEVAVVAEALATLLEAYGGAAPPRLGELFLRYWRLNQSGTGPHHESLLMQKWARRLSTH